MRRPAGVSVGPPTVPGMATTVRGVGATLAGAVPVQSTIDELGTPLRDVTFVVVDLETTGGSPDDCGITEIGAVKVRGGEVLGEFQTLVNPGAPDPAVHRGADRHHRRDGRRRAAACARRCPAFLEFARGAVLVAHNAPFDVGFLKAAARAARRRLARFRRRSTPPGSPASVVRRDEAPNCKLATLAAAVPFADDARPPGADRRPGHRRRAARADRAGRQPRRAHPRGAAARTARGCPPRAPQARPRRRPARRAGRVRLPRRARPASCTSARSVDIRTRVRTYFTAAEKRRRMAEMVRARRRRRPVVCATPLEAEVRELRLIAEHKPALQPALARSPSARSGSSSPTSRSPGCRWCAQVRDDGAAYFGPFGAAGAAEAAVAALHEAFPLRQCAAAAAPAPAPAPARALLADLGRCGAPCNGAPGRGGLRRASPAPHATP